MSRFYDVPKGWLSGVVVFKRLLCRRSVESGKRSEE